MAHFTHTRPPMPAGQAKHPSAGSSSFNTPAFPCHVTINATHTASSAYCEHL